MRQPITVSSAARILEIPERAVRDLERRGDLPAIRVANMRLFERKVVEKLAALRKNAKPPSEGRK